MTPDQLDDLVLQTIEDLHEKLVAGDWYALRRAAGLVRQLLLDGDEKSIAVLSARRHQVDLRFTITRDVGSTDPGVIVGLRRLSNMGEGPMSAEWSAENETTLTFEKFIAVPVTMAEDRPFTVKQIIRYFAHVAGGVHVGGPRDPGEAELVAAFGAQTADPGEWAHSVVEDVGWVVLRALEPLENAIGASRTTAVRKSPPRSRT